MARDQKKQPQFKPQRLQWVRRGHLTKLLFLTPHGEMQEFSSCSSSLGHTGTRCIAVNWNYCIKKIICLFRATPSAYGSSQARGQNEAAAAILHHSHSNAGSELGLWPTPQLTATPDPQPTGWGQGSNLHPHGYLLGSLPLSHNGNSLHLKKWNKTKNRGCLLNKPQEGCTLA